MQALLQDLQYAWRQFRRAPGFALTVVLTLALSVGVATAVFCVVNTVILQPLPYDNPDRIMAVLSKSHSGYNQPNSWPSFVDERAQAQSFKALAGFAGFMPYTVDTPAAGPVLLDGVRSTDNFFTVFGVKPLLGRTYLPGEEQDGKNDIVVLGYDTWQKYFGGDKNIVGKPIKLNGRAFTIIGVMPAGFHYPLFEENAIYTPMHVDETWMKQRGNHWLQAVARLKDGVNEEHAQADLEHVFANMGAQHEEDKDRTVRLLPLIEQVNKSTKGPLWTLLAAVLAVLAIGCVNVAGLLLARGVKREREMAMRSAIGARRGRLVRQVLTESMLLAVAGALGGIVLAWAMLDLMRVFLTQALARGADIHMNWVVLGAAIAASVVASLAASLYPALRMAGTDPNHALKAGGNAGAGRGQHRLRAGFVITQVALTLVLLVVAGMLIRMVGQYSHEDLGFDAAHILSAEINLSPAKYNGRDPIADFYQPLFDRVMQIPGVKAVGVNSNLPIQNWGSNSDIHIAGQPPYPPNQEMLSETRMVSAGYFDVFGIPLRRGRKLSPGIDGIQTPNSTTQDIASTVVVNEAFVRKFIPPGLEAVGQRFDNSTKDEEKTRIVGVMGNVRQDIYQPPLAEHDYLIDGITIKDRATFLSGMYLVIRTAGDPASIIPTLRSVLHEIDPTVPFKTPETMTEVISKTLVFERMESWLFGIFASLALVLALVGLYGLVSHEVERQTRDIGVRMALGATRSRVMAMVMKRVAWMLGIGAVVGLVLTALARKIIDMVIFFDAKHEAGNMFTVALVLIVAGLLAALIPARRAASVEPMQALRTE